MKLATSFSTLLIPIVAPLTLAQEPPRATLKDLLAAEKFTWTKGGVLLDRDLGRFRVKVGSWPQGALLPFLKFEF